MEAFRTCLQDFCCRRDLDYATAQVAAQGHVTSQSVHGLYAVTKRANSFTVGMAMELEISRVRIEPDALEELRALRSHHLPASIRYSPTTG